MTISTFTNSLRRAWRELDLSFRTFHDIQFSAPWLRRSRLSRSR